MIAKLSLLRYVCLYIRFKIQVPHHMTIFIHTPRHTETLASINIPQIFILCNPLTPLTYLLNPTLLPQSSSQEVEHLWFCLEMKFLS